jgi:hypothetical protein
VDVSVEERGCSFGLAEALGSSRRVYAHIEEMEGLARRCVRMCEPYREFVRLCAVVKIRKLGNRNGGRTTRPVLPTSAADVIAA